MSTKNTKVISFINYKGGVGKSTITYNIGATLENIGKKVLLIDFDGQGNLTSFIGVDPMRNNWEKGTLVDKLNDIISKKEITDYPIYNFYGELYIIPCNITKEKWITDAYSSLARETILKRLIDKIKEQYDFDYILIDNAPSVNIDLHNSLVTSDYFSIIAEPEMASTDGIKNIGDVIDLVSEFFNPNLQSLGVIINKVDERTNLHSGMIEMIKSIFVNYEIFNTKIPRSIIASESQAVHVPICKYKSGSKIDIAFHNLANEFLEKIENEICN